MSDYDYLKDVESGPSDDQIREIARLADRQRMLESDLETLQKAVKETSTQLQLVAERDLPEAMTAAGVAEFKLVDGTKIEVKENLYASVPKANLPRVTEWLMEHGLGSLVKEDVVVMFGKDEREKETELLEFLRDHETYAARYSQKPAVNTTSLKAAIKELMDAGQEVPLKLFGAYQLRRSKITRE